MKKKLSIHGATWHIYLNSTIASFMGITDSEKTVQLTMRNKTLYVQQSNETTNEKSYLRKLFKRGAGYGLNLPLPILELLDINPEIDLVDINIENNQLIIKKVD